MTALNAAMWGLIIASIVGIMVGCGELAYDKINGCGCAPNHRAILTLYTSILVGAIAAVANTAITAAMT
uniref:hypothetical protein n=1 Tax=Cryobacterium sp. TaxID=1926290 RepID=UPI001597EF89|nr:hypothetical protein [Cryobacterium sp.]QJS06138.1 hypothetical protein [Cryobacterium sp.]